MFKINDNYLKLPGSYLFSTIAKKVAAYTEADTMSDEHACCCSDRKRQRTDEEYKRLMNRLSRIEGQIRGVKGMLENDAYCTDIVLQVSAINAALNSFNKVLLAEHIRTCVADDIRNGKDDTIEDLVNTITRLMK